MSNTTTIALVGNPNCGKSLLFNALTNQRQTVGNWSGVTVDKKMGEIQLPNHTVNLLDLPGIQSAHHYPDQQAIDTQISCHVLASGEMDLCLNIIDACYLEKGLALTQHLRRLATPMLLVINKLDLAKKQGLSINTQALARELRCPVIAVSGKNKQDIKRLRQEIGNALAAGPQPPPKRNQAIPLLRVENELSKLIAQETSSCPKHARDTAERLLCGADTASFKLSDTLLSACKRIIKDSPIKDATTSYCDSDFSEAQRLHQLAVTHHSEKTNISYHLDRIFLHRWLGVPFFFLIMYLLFFFAINVGGAFQDAFELFGDTVFVDLPAQCLMHWHSPTWLIAILANGIGKGLSTTLTFIPVIAALFLFLSLLEETGYLARAAFVIDRLMQTLHLPGQAFIPMIIGFGCNVPAIMGTRSLSHTSDRIITALMTPFMSCGARLAIFAIFANAFFAHGGSLMVFLLYLIGLVVAVLTGLLVRRLLLHSYHSHWLMSLPDYQRPRLRAIGQRVKRRVSSFVKRAGRVIVPTCALIGALTQVNLSLTHGIYSTTPNQSALASIGRAVTPLFEPMGIQPNNWPATVGLATGVMAKEVVIATLNTLYENKGAQEEVIHWRQRLVSAYDSIVVGLQALPQALINPILASAPDQAMTNTAYQRMQTAFGHPINAFCYLLFILLYFPCISTLAVMRQELGNWWGSFSVTWSTAIAYIIATDTYQIATWPLHPTTASAWLAGSGLIIYQQPHHSTSPHEPNKRKHTDTIPFLVSNSITLTLRRLPRWMCKINSR